jgi:hypothetical protein
MWQSDPKGDSSLPKWATRPMNQRRLAGENSRKQGTDKRLLSGPRVAKETYEFAQRKIWHFFDDTTGFVCRTEQMSVSSRYGLGELQR